MGDMSADVNLHGELVAADGELKVHEVKDTGRRMEMMPWTLYYDGGCNLCHASKLRVERWAERQGRPLSVDILQSDEAIAKGYGDAMVVEADGQVYQGAPAWLKLMELAPLGLRWIAWLAKVPGVRQLMIWGYGVVARYRYRWFGRRACPIPSQKSQQNL